MKPPGLLEQIASAAPMAAKLDRVRGGETITFEHVVPAAQPLLAALLAGAVQQRVWVVCPDIQRQEAIHNEMSQWRTETLFFPEIERAPVEGAIADPESAAERLAVLDALTGKKGRQIIVVTKASLNDEVPTLAALRKLERRLRRGAELERDELVRQLAGAGYEAVTQISARGQFAIRGGILDVFSFQHALPVRIELFDETIESIREFDLDAQTSVRILESCTLLLGEASDGKKSAPTQPVSAWLEAKDLVIDAGADYLAAQVRILEGSEGMAAAEDFANAFHEHGLGEFEAGDFVIDELKRERFFTQLREWRAGGWTVYIYCNNEGEIERLRDLVPPVEAEALRFTIGTLAHGFIFPAGRVAVLSDAELFGRYRNQRARRIALRREREQASRVQIDFSDLHEDDYVVHLEHGIGRYEGLRSIPRPDGGLDEVLVIAFAEEARIYVPLEQAFLVSRYVGVGRRNPPLSKLGDERWAKAKKNAQAAVQDYAAKLLQVHAERETARGFAFPPDKQWQREFESSFLFRETPDQLTAIAATKADMESTRPMDRLICGDVGFGKTEVAIRAAFKAVMGGKQVAILVPTTVLAEQHYRNFRERMSDYPIAVDLLSRFRTVSEQRHTVQSLKDGRVDIVVGTHRLISKDIAFKNLGLVVIDEEQRFGVLHKEKFKDMFKLVDLLTLSATPIPRTLYLSLMGAKDMSTIETPPPNRIPTETFICPYDERIIRDAIQRELARQGQVYFLHNRVGTIEAMRDKIARLCPRARLVIGHGQMEEHQLEEVMHRFVSGQADVLISTTIIESGLDIPNANTIIIDRADRFGLADLYQLRGRVGRAQHKAYAYLLLPRDMLTQGEARRRINAIQQYSSLGAGFKIAMRDLEIRGAGNILGTQQSGHIVNIGFELYCSLLKQAVARQKGEKVRARLEVNVRTDFLAMREAEFRTTDRTHAPAFLPSAYLAESQPRIQAYRRLAEVTTPEQLETLRKVWRDRFGPLPREAENLLVITELKLAAAARKITSVEVRAGKVMLTRHGEYVQISGKFPRAEAADPEARLREVLQLVRAF